MRFGNGRGAELVRFPPWWCGLLHIWFGAPSASLLTQFTERCDARLIPQTRPAHLFSGVRRVGAHGTVAGGGSGGRWGAAPCQPCNVGTAHRLKPSPAARLVMPPEKHSWGKKCWGGKEQQREPTPKLGEAGGASPYPLQPTTPEPMDIPRGTVACGESTPQHIFLKAFSPWRIHARAEETWEKEGAAKRNPYSMTGPLLHSQTHHAAWGMGRSWAWVQGEERLF